LEVLARDRANGDYGYQRIVPESVWIAALPESAQEQNWGNFKTEVA